jgi:hypothetical protein
VLLGHSDQDLGLRERDEAYERVAGQPGVLRQAMA